jgi:hypothetical protein
MHFLCEADDDMDNEVFLNPGLEGGCLQSSNDRKYTKCLTVKVTFHFPNVPCSRTEQAGLEVMLYIDLYSSGAWFDTENPD